MKYANLHLHSNFSDGGFTPKQLIRIGKSLGYRALALTDHETDGGVRDFMNVARQEGIHTLAGVEFYGTESGVKPHLVALDYDMEDPGIRALIDRLVEGRNECTRKCVERGIELGFVQGITWNDVLDLNMEGSWLCIDSVIRAMEIKKAVPADYDWATFRANVFNAPEPRTFRPKAPTAEEVIKTVRKAGGIIALAHCNEHIELLDKLVSYGLNGIEVSHPDLYRNYASLAVEAAEKYNLYRCGGTDHTGAMSCCGGNLAIPALEGITDEEFMMIKERRLG